MRFRVQLRVRFKMENGAAATAAAAERIIKVRSYGCGCG